MKKQILCIVALLIWFSSVAFPKADQNSPSSEPKASTTNAAKDSSIAPPGKLMVPPLALDDTSITVIWEKPADYSNVVSYKVYQNGSLAGTTKNLFYTIAGLEPNSPYSITVKSVDASGNESQPGNKVVQSTAPAMKVFDVTKYGAIGDGNTLNTKAIQKAIDECTAGGKVLVPAGTFLSGALFLKSDMTIQIDGTLMGSDDINEYPMTNLRFPYYLSGKGYMGLINAYTEKYGSLTNIKICGKGNMCGGKWDGGKNTVLGIKEAAVSNNDSGRSDLITAKGINNLYIGGLTFTNPAMHVIMITYSKNVTVTGITANTFDIHNADGIDLATSDTAYIFNSTFDTGDDCINFNAGVGADGVKENFPDQNIRVFNCLTKRGHGGVVFGSFTAAWIQNVLVEDCIFDGTEIGLRFKTNESNGGGARNVLCRDITIKNTIKDSAIFFDSAYTHTPSGYPSGGPGQFKDITIKNITSENLKKYGIWISGLPKMPHTNINISNVTINGGKAGGAAIKSATNCKFENITIKNSTPVWIIDPNSTSGLEFKNCDPKP